MADITAANGGTVQPQTRFGVPASAYLTTHDGRLYVGSFDEDDPGSVYSVPLGADGSLGAAGLRGHRAAALAGARRDRRRLRVQHVVGAQEPQRAHLDLALGRGRAPDAPNMSEGLVIVNGQVYTVYESGATAYQYDGNHPAHNITITPLDAIK